MFETPTRYAIAPSCRYPLENETNPKSKTTLAAYLKMLRERSGLSRRELAIKSEVSRMTIWRWERGESVPHFVELQQTLAALNPAPSERNHAYSLRESERVRFSKPDGGRSASSSDALRRRRKPERCGAQKAGERLCASPGPIF